MTLYLVRHADAGKRDPCSNSDHLRDLSEAGRLQARRIADRLGVVGVTRVLSSPYPRCVRTVEPLARRLGLEVEPCGDLSEGSNARGALALLEDLAGTEAVLCSHGDVIPDVIRLLAARGVVIGDRRGSAKGSIWTIGTGDGRLLAAHYTKTPREPDAARR